MSAGLRWLDRLAHDLRGPLTPLQSAVYLLRNGHLDAQRQGELLELVERQSRQLARMIDELADWSCAGNAGLLPRPCEPQEVSLLLDAALGGTATGAATPTVVDDSGQASVRGDAMRLVQMLRILIEYASTRDLHNPLSLRLQRDDGALRVDVIAGTAPDTGQLAGLLRDPQPEPSDQGLGLQLLIARAIAEAHGGALVADADADGKLRLRCTLPLA